MVVVLILAAVVLLLVVLVLLPRVTVTGHSMVPVLHDGHRLLVLPLRPVEGRMVVLRHPRQPGRLIVKRVTRIHADGQIEVVGDNIVASTDSRHFGPVPRELVLGRPVYRYSPADQAGWMLRR